jgi:exodeoxyribonuclease V alpha subunit
MREEMRRRLVSSFNCPMNTLLRHCQSATLGSMELLRGVVERLTYHNEETGYTVAKLSPEYTSRLGMGEGREITVVGNMLGVNVGESVELSGRWTVHAEYGRQFQVEQMRTVLPATVAGIEKYLGSGLVKGVGPETAKRIVRHFGVSTLEVIEQQPERLTEVPGVGSKRQQQIVAAWAEQQAIKEVMLFLQSHGVTTSLATKIYKYYGDEAIGIVRSDPYRLARDIYGIGFLTADKIARALGIPSDSPERIAAGLLYALNQASDEGHVFLPTSELVKSGVELLDVTQEQAATGIVQLWSSNEVKVAPEAGGNALSPVPTDITPQLVVGAGQLFAAATIEQARELLQQEQAIYLTPFYFSEVGVAGRFHRLLREGSSRLTRFARVQDWEGRLAHVENDAGVILAPHQRAAVQTALTHRLTILTGGPGTGKTTTVRTILLLCQQAGHRVLLAAPTGRAAKRLAETTGQEAKTLHRLLEFQPSEGMTFKRNEEMPLEGDLLIIDESSMLDLVLTNHLLRAIPPGMHLLLVGDVDQLPSVGAGNVLKDVIGAVDELHQMNHPLAAQAAVVRLQTIFRQAADSFIITNAHRINRGEMPVMANQGNTDFYLFKTDEPERAAQLVVELVQERIPRRFAIPTQDIQVLSPMHRGVVGVGQLNDALQAALNPPASNAPQRQLGSRVFRAGDRVMQIRNNYDKDVYNGDMGVITAVDLEMQKLAVMMDGRVVPYDFLELDELVHAFAISVHKSQGSEFPAVVVPVLTSHYMMLQRNLLYTAVTRARRLVVLVGQPKAIAMAVRNDQVAARYTGLRNRLLQESL